MAEPRRLRMVRDSLADLPPMPVVPPRLAIRGYRPGDGPRWNALVAACYPELPPEPDALTRIFGDDPAALAERMGLLVGVDDDGVEQVLGTATAWHGAGGLGRIHWVAVAPLLQGGGMGRALVVWALHRLAALGHGAAYLMTEDFRLPAIGLYRSLGFRPDPRDAAEAAAWDELLPLLALGRP